MRGGGSGGSRNSSRGGGGGQGPQRGKSVRMFQTDKQNKL